MKISPRARCLPLVLAVALALPLALLGACSTPDKPAPVQPRLAIERPGKALVEATEADDGARIVVERTQVLELSLALPGNQSPDWSLVDPAPGAFTVTGPRFERTVRDRSIDDAAGSTVWRFQPLVPGEYALRFELRRPRSTLPPMQTLSYSVTVR